MSRVAVVLLGNCLGENQLFNPMSVAAIKRERAF